MTRARPPIPLRWEFHLGVGLLGLLLTLWKARSPGREAPEDEVDTAAAETWRAQRRSERAQHPWLDQLDRERVGLRALLELWLAWRSYRLERTNQGPRPL